jgi:hypothetical protein
LHLQLRRSYPSQANVIHTLPEKDFFRYMDPHVVEKRRKSLEEYVTRIVQRLPTVSPSFFSFLSSSASLSASLLSFSASKKNFC